MVILYKHFYVGQINFIKNQKKRLRFMKILKNILSLLSLTNSEVYKV